MYECLGRQVGIECFYKTFAAGTGVYHQTRCAYGFCHLNLTADCLHECLHRERTYNTQCAYYRYSVNYPEFGIEGFLSQFGTAGYRYGYVQSAFIQCRQFLNNHLAGYGIDCRFTYFKTDARQCDTSHAFTLKEMYSGLTAQGNLYPDRASVCNVRVIAGILYDRCLRPVLVNQTFLYRKSEYLTVGDAESDPGLLLTA